MVWLGSRRGAPLRARAAPQPIDGHYVVEDVAADAPVRARLTTPYVQYVGSHEGCGCGFNSADLAWDGLTRLSDVTPLVEALSEDERGALAAQQRSRVRLRDLVETALADGPVEVYGCWDGDESLEATGEASVDPSHFTEVLAPIEERVLYRIASSARG